MRVQDEGIPSEFSFVTQHVHPSSACLKKIQAILVMKLMNRAHGRIPLGNGKITLNQGKLLSTIYLFMSLEDYQYERRKSPHR
jgi:hypothetical protein